MSRPLKIAHLALSSLPIAIGGLQIVVDSLIRHQRARGNDVHLVTRWKSWKAARAAGDFNVHPLPPRLSLDNTPFRSVGARWPVAATARFHQLRHKFDIWHVHWLYPAGWMVHDTLRRAGVPVVMTAHGADLLADQALGYGVRQFPTHDRRVRSLVPRAEVLTAISDTIAGTYLELGARPEAIHRIDNGVDIEHIRSARPLRHDTRERLDIAPDVSAILTVGRNQPSKGLQFIPPALRHLKDRAAKVVWIVVGQDSDLLAAELERAGVADMARLVPQFGPDQHRRFPPEGLAHLYAAADVFAFPSLSEGFGLVALEAMAAGVPVVGNDVSGIRDVISHGSDGLLCPPGEPIKMAEAIMRIIGDRPLAARLIGGGETKARAHDWREIAGQYLELYHQTLAAGR